MRRAPLIYFMIVIRSFITFSYTAGPIFMLVARVYYLNTSTVRGIPFFLDRPIKISRDNVT